MRLIRSFHQEVLFAWAVLYLQDDRLRINLQALLDHAYKRMQEGESTREFFPSLMDTLWTLRLNILRWAATRGMDMSSEMADVIQWLDTLKTDSAAVELFDSIQIAMEASGRVVAQFIETTSVAEEMLYVPDEIFLLKYSQLREIIKLTETPYRSDVLISAMEASLALELGSLIAVDIYAQRIPVTSEQVADLTVFIRSQTSLYCSASSKLIDFISQDMVKSLTMTNQWPSFVNDMFGCMSDAPISRYDEGDYETRAELL